MNRDREPKREKFVVPILYERFSSWHSTKMISLYNLIGEYSKDGGIDKAQLDNDLENTAKSVVSCKNRAHWNCGGRETWLAFYSHQNQDQKQKLDQIVSGIEELFSVDSQDGNPIQISSDDIGELTNNRSVELRLITSLAFFLRNKGYLVKVTALSNETSNLKVIDRLHFYEESESKEVEPTKLTFFLSIC